MKKRFIYDNNGTLQNYTEEINNYHVGETTVTFVAAEAAYFVGSNLPFNHVYFLMGSTVNAETSAMSVSLWDGTEWQAVAELIDNTSVSGATLAQSGFIEFVPDKNEGWAYDDTVDSDGNEEITGLGGVTIYDKYWLKITASADLTADLAIKWIGQIFSDDDDLGSENPELLLSDMLTAIEAGKTNYQEQAVRAAGIMIKDLKRKNVISDKNQILERDSLMLASVSKTAELIYTMLGDDYNDNKLVAKKEYSERLSSAFPIVDKNNNARTDMQETVPQHGFLSR